MGQNLDLKAAYAVQAAAQKPKRVCTDCGKPTHNYRCNRCWRKKRGYGFDESGDEAAVTAEARQCMLLNDAAAKQERREAAAARGPDWFTPSTKYGQPPPAPPPGEQKRIAPAMPAKGHRGQWPRPPVNYWMPKRGHKEKEPSMPEQEQKKKLTVADLAVEADISPSSAYQVLSCWRKGKGLNSPAALKLRTVLDRLGLAWEDLGRPAKRRSSAAASASAPAPQVEASASTAEPEEEEAGITFFVDTRPAPALMERLLREEEERLAADAGAVHPAADADALDSIIDELTAEEPEEEEPGPAREVFRPERPDYGRDFPLSHIPMEALVSEITRRVPRAQVVLC